jgi:processive 1,2-diacylglycerol beta-glucosyltransferase
MPKILVLHVSAGTGHTSAATAIGEALRQHNNVEVHVEDVFAHINEMAAKLIQNGYNEISTKAQPLYTLVHSRLYVEDTERALNSNWLTAAIQRPFLLRFEQYVQQLAPDAIICTMQIPLQVTQFYDLHAPTYAVVTDFSLQSTWLRAGVTRYFVASEYTRDLLLERGLPPEQVRVTGIPVRLAIAEPKDPLAMRQQHNLPADRPLITVFGGGVETRQIREMVEGLLAGQAPATLAVVAGRNKELSAALSDLASGPQVELRLLGFVDYVDDLVTASDLVISKPGGLITSEVLARGTPMLVIAPVPGQEDVNADVVAGSGAGIQLRLPEMAAPAVGWLLANPARLDAMRLAARALGKPRAAHSIAEHVLADLHSQLSSPAGQAEH